MASEGQRAAKESELRGLTRPTLKQLARQHHISAKRSYSSDELRSRLLAEFPCTRHDAECLLVLQTVDSDTDDDDDTTPSVKFAPSVIETTPRMSMTPADLRVRRRTWNLKEVQIGDRLFSPQRNIKPDIMRRASLSVRQSFSLAALVQIGEDETPHEEKAEFEREHVNTLTALNETHDEEVDEKAERPVMVQSVDEKRPMAASATERQRRAQKAHTRRMLAPTQPTAATENNPTAWPVKATQSQKVKSRTTAEIQLRRQTIAINSINQARTPKASFDVAGSRARTPATTVLRDRSNVTSSPSASSDKPSRIPRSRCQVKSKGSIDTTGERSHTNGKRQAISRRTSIDNARHNRSRAQENRPVQ